MNINLHGTPVIESPFLTITETTQTFIPRSKKRRIIKKCRRKYAQTTTYPDPHIYKVAGVGIIGHPAAIVRMKEILDNVNRKIEEEAIRGCNESGSSLFYNSNIEGGSLWNSAVNANVS